MFGYGLGLAASLLALIVGGDHLVVGVVERSWLSSTAALCIQRISRPCG